MQNIFDGDAIARQYHTRQWANPNRSTIALAEFFGPELRASKRVVDLGCGAGAPTAYLARMFPAVQFTGLDFVSSLIDIAKGAAIEHGIGNIAFDVADWHNLPDLGQVDGVMSIQTLCCVNGWERALAGVFDRVRPAWIGLHSLFYDGDISLDIRVQEHARDRDFYFYVVAVPALTRMAERHGYRLARYEPFAIDIDLARGDPDAMGTFTVPTAAGSRVQISGPMLMQWGNVCLVRA